MSESALLVQISNNIVLVIEIIAIVFIMGIVAYFLVMFARVSNAKIRGKKVSFSLHDIIYRFLRGLLISLDFVIAADILKAIFDRSIEELITLAIVVIIRILMSWSLSKDFEFSDKKEGESPINTCA